MWECGNCIQQLGDFWGNSNSMELSLTSSGASGIIPISSHVVNCPWHGSCDFRIGRRTLEEYGILLLHFIRSFGLLYKVVMTIAKKNKLQCQHLGLLACLVSHQPR